MNMRIASGLVTVVAALVLSSAALAKSGPCSHEKASMCKDVKKGMMKTCLKDHYNDLSQSCKDHLDKKKK